VHTGGEIKRELEGVGVRLDKRRPDVGLRRKSIGGITITKVVKLTRLTDETIKTILAANSAHNADVVFREDVGEDELIDMVMGNRVYIPSVVVVNKIDLNPKVRVPADYIPISATEDVNLDRLRETMFRKLDFIRVYLKPQGSKADYGEPLVLKRGATVRDLCLRMHKDFLEKFRYAIVWGESVKHEGQRCGITHVLKDIDTVTIIRKL
jgi:hypothetical protein